MAVKTFKAFVESIHSGNPSVDAFKAHVSRAGFLKATTWGEMRREIQRAGGGDDVLAGARLAWSAFRKQ